MDVLNVVAGVGSIVGLLFSILAFWQARRASVAAREAREAILVRNLAEELHLVCIRGPRNWRNNLRTDAIRRQHSESGN
jgi:hypothetical protein